MTLQFDPTPYLQVWQRNQQLQDQRRVDPNTAISQPILQGLQMLADSRRQQQLLDVQKQTAADQQQAAADQQQKNAYEYGTPIDQNTMVADNGTQTAKSAFMPGGQGPVASPGRLVDAYNAWRAGGMKGPARPEFIPALGKDERSQLFKAQNQDDANYVAPQYDAAGNVTGWSALPPGTKPASIPRPFNPTGVTTSGLSWDTATPTQQNMAVAMVKGNIRPSDLGLRDRATIVGLANEYANKNSMPFQSYGGEVKAKTANYFASGKGGQNATSLNTALGHLGDAVSAYNNIQNTNQAWLNTPLNVLRQKTNDPDVISLGINLNALQGELANVFKNSGGTDQEIAKWGQYLNENLTPSQYRAAAEKVNDLLRSRLNALDYQQGDVMGGGGPQRTLLSPRGAATMNTIQSWQSPQGGSGQTVTFQDSDGKMHTIPSANLAIALQRDPGLRIMGGQ